MKAAAINELRISGFQLGSQAVSVQQQLMQGWTGRLISSTFNAPGTETFVASQFTRLEAARFLGGMVPAFGFVNEADRNAWFNWGQLSQYEYGLMGQPGGIARTGLGAMGNPSYPLTMHPHMGGDMTGANAPIAGAFFMMHPANIMDRVNEIHRGVAAGAGGASVGHAAGNTVIDNGGIHITGELTLKDPSTRATSQAAMNAVLTPNSSGAHHYQGNPSSTNPPRQ